MRICMQDPNQPIYCLHEELLLASMGAITGAGVFAFATKSGVDLLLQDEVFIEFIKASTFLLIVGTDEITNTRTIESLTLIAAQYPNLKIKAFINEYSNVTFHPKYCWFKQTSGGYAIIGSGNLTQQGLRKNWETFSVIDLNGQQMFELEQQWYAWLHINRRFLKEINDPAVISRVKENNWVMKRKKLKIGLSLEQKEEEAAEEEAKDIALIEEELDEEIESWTFSLKSRLLVAEIPKASNRWNQANFDKKSFENFFGATPGDNNLRVLFRGIDQEHQLHKIEIRQSVSVRSHNWRFELDLAKNYDYPDNGRPIGVFIEVSNRMFLYMLIMPSMTGHQELTKLLSSRSELSVRREEYEVEYAKEWCPQLAIWDYLR